MKKKICTICLGNGWLDNDFTIYDDGSIFHLYDKHETRSAIEKWMNVSDLSDSLKENLIDKCDEQFKLQISLIFSS